MIRIVGRLVEQNDQVFFLGRAIKRTVRAYSVEANPKYIRDVVAVLGLEKSKSSDDSECQENSDDRITC